MHHLISSHDHSSITFSLVEQFLSLTSQARPADLETEIERLHLAQPHRLIMALSFRCAEKSLANYLKVFWTSGSPKGVLSNRPCPLVCGLWSVVRPSVFKYLRDRSFFFLIFCIKLEHHKGTKVTEPDFWKKIFGGTNGRKPPFLGYFWCFSSISLHPLIKSYQNFIYIISLTLSNT